MASPNFKIHRAGLSTSLDLPSSANISNVEHLASYNWLEAPTPIIAVPGSPAAWANVKKKRQIKKDGGLIYIAQNAARHPSSPLEPLFRALDIEKPDYDVRSIDIISDRNNLRKLFSFVDPSTMTRGLEPFTIKVEIIGTNVVFCRDETKVQEFIAPNEFRGYGHEFEKAYTNDKISGSTGHHRVLSYKFGGMHLVVRHETDGYIEEEKKDVDRALESLGSLSLVGSQIEDIAGSKLAIKHVGNIIPLSSTLEIKTRASHKPIPFDEVAVQLWLSQTPKLVRAYHSQGLFEVPVVEDKTDDINAWETKNQRSIRTLAALLSKLVDVTKGWGKAVIRRDHNELVVAKVAKGENMLPDDLYLRWKKGEQKVAKSGNEKHGGLSLVESFNRDVSGRDSDKA